jgi:hypothetical protein
MRADHWWEAYTDGPFAISTPQMAVSWQTARWIEDFCYRERPKSVTDLGSGLTSVVLRDYAKHTGAHVVSVDDNLEWLDKTRAFCEKNQLVTGNMMLLNDWLAALDTLPPSDFTVYDLGAELVVRFAHIDTAIRQLSEGGAILFDDYSTLTEEIDAAVIANGLDLTVQPDTRDEWMRICALATRP